MRISDWSSDVCSSDLDTIERVLPYYEAASVPELAAGKTVLISAHGNSLRALVKHLSGISDADITGLEIPTGQPIVSELNHDQLSRASCRDRASHHVSLSHAPVSLPTTQPSPSPPHTPYLHLPTPPPSSPLTTPIPLTHPPPH